MLTSFLFKMALASSMFSLVLAVYVLRQDPRKAENISFAAGMMTLSFIAFSQFMDYLSFNPIFWKNLAFAGRIFLPVPWLVFSIVFARTDPAHHLRKWRVWIGGVSLTSLIMLGVHFYISFHGDGLTHLTFRYWKTVFLLIALTLVLANFEWTLRSGEHPQRWRIKFLIVGISSIFLFMIFHMTYFLLFPRADSDFSHIAPTVIFIGSFLSALSLIRRGMHDVNIAVSRDVVRNSIIVLLVGGCLLAVGLVAQAIRMFGGDFREYLQYILVFLALVFIALVLLSTHARKTAKMFIDRHFFRRKFDYEKEWLKITSQMSSKLDVGEISSSLANVFSEIFWIDTTLLWLSGDMGNDFRMVYPDNRRINDPMRENPVLFPLLKEKNRPVLLEELQESQDLSEEGGRQIDSLKKRGISLLVPMMLDRELVGVLGLSKSRYGAPFDIEDLALINTISGQAASSLLNAKLAVRIVQSKELETFHIFSAFVIHDLKNFVSMLSLVVQNMEKNFGNPAFQKDAMASLTTIAEKMEQMMRRLSALSTAPIRIKTKADLNRLLRGLINEMKGTIRSRVVEDYSQLPDLFVDSEQMTNVFRNLVKNADEATANGGEIRLSTAMKDRNAIVTISDNGRGIPKEYMEGEMFTPFSSTKSDGLGIGLFQAKRIVESHGGRIEAESEVGKGSTFRIHLPVAGE